MKSPCVKKKGSFETYFILYTKIILKLFLIRKIDLNGKPKTIFPEKKKRDNLCDLGFLISKMLAYQK